MNSNKSLISGLDKYCINITFKIIKKRLLNGRRKELLPLAILGIVAIVAVMGFGNDIKKTLLGCDQIILIPQKWS